MCACMVHAVLLGQSRCSRCLALHTPPAPLCTRPLSAHAPPLYADGPSLLPPPYTSPLCSFPPCPRCWAGPGARGPELYSFQVFVVCLVQSWNSSCVCVCVCACVRACAQVLNSTQKSRWAGQSRLGRRRSLRFRQRQARRRRRRSRATMMSTRTIMIGRYLLLECVPLLCH